MNEDDVWRQIGNEIRVWRKARKMNQIDLARAVDLSRVSISSIETGRFPTTLASLHRICIALGTTVPEMLAECSAFYEARGDGRTG